MKAHTLGQRQTHKQTPYQEGEVILQTEKTKTQREIKTHKAKGEARRKVHTRCESEWENECE